MEKKRVPDTPWHIGFTKKEADDPRRHKARCIHKVDGICRYGKSGCYMLQCGGSAHCKYYAETEEQAKKIRLDNMTIEEETEERAEQYRIRKIKEWEKLSALGANELRKKYGNYRLCPVCDEKLNAKRICNYCGFNFEGRMDLVKIPGVVVEHSRNEVHNNSPRRILLPDSFSIKTNDKVIHKKWGKGTVVRASKDTIIVRFKNCEKSFQNPEAFQYGYLTKII